MRRTPPCSTTQHALEKRTRPSTIPDAAGHKRGAVRASPRRQPIDREPSAGGRRSGVPPPEESVGLGPAADGRYDTAAAQLAG